jgi:hypothetical protein
MNNKKRTPGRPMLYGEKTVNLSIKVPKSKYDHYKKVFHAFLSLKEKIECNTDITE